MVLECRGHGRRGWDWAALVGLRASSGRQTTARSRLFMVAQTLLRTVATDLTEVGS